MKPKVEAPPGSHPTKSGSTLFLGDLRILFLAVIVAFGTVVPRVQVALLVVLLVLVGVAVIRAVADAS